MIRFHCSTCNNRIRVPTSYAGRKVKCPHCHKAIEVPAAEPAAEEPAQPSTPSPSESDGLAALAAASETTHDAPPEYAPEAEEQSYAPEPEQYDYDTQAPPPEEQWPPPTVPLPSGDEAKVPAYLFISIVGWIYTVLGGLSVLAALLALVFGLIGGATASNSPGGAVAGLGAGMAMALYFILIAFILTGMGQLFFGFRDLCRNSWKLKDISVAIRQLAAQQRY